MKIFTFRLIQSSYTHLTWKTWTDLCSQQMTPPPPLAASDPLFCSFLGSGSNLQRSQCNRQQPWWFPYNHSRNKLHTKGSCACPCSSPSPSELREGQSCGEYPVQMNKRHMIFLFPHYCDQDIQGLSYQSYRVRIQTGIYLTPEGKLVSKKQDVCLDEGQPPGQPAGTRTSFPPRDTKQGSEVIKSYLWSSCSKAGRVMQKRKKTKQRKTCCLQNPGGGDTHKDEKGATEAGEPCQERSGTWQPHQLLCLVMEPVLLWQWPP